MGKAASICALLYFAFSLRSATALPSPVATIEVVPGPGMPSLAELGLTSADLFRMTPAIGARESDPGLTKRFNPFCQYSNQVNRDNAIACYNYLNALGTQGCGVDTNINFCQAGDAFIGGSAIAGSHTGSYCRDVAAGALWVINSCNSGNRVEGAAPAYGNGNLVVSIEPWGA